MKLKKLTALGFKSFADKITIDFDCEVIGVVGPNGCGKSNIVDAFRWVMGEQSAKSLRGDKMHDVLFAGTDTRKPMGYAEVSITLTDVQNELPIDYDEITITRRLYKDGESEYLINRQTVRLKDIQDLFLGSGIGKRAFSVLEQGKLDQVIHLNPTERRIIFDEAAGIGRFLQRKKETLRKLKQVSENHQRVKDIHAEVEKQTRQLKRQAAQAADYKENQSRLSGLERAVLVTKWQALQSKGAGFEELLGDLTERVAAEQAIVVSLGEKLANQRESLFEEEQKAKTEARRLYQTQTASQVYETEIKQQNQRVVEMTAREKKLGSEIQEIERNRKKNREESEQKRVSQGEFEKHKEALSESLKKEKVSREHFQERLSKLNNEFKQEQKSHLKCVQEQGRLNTELSQKRLLIEAHEARVEEKEGVEKLISEKKAVVAQLSDEIDRFKAGIEGCEKTLKDCLDEISKLKESETKLMQDLADTSAREKNLIRLREQFSVGTKQLLEAVTGVEIKRFTSDIPHYADTLVVKKQEELEKVLAFAEAREITNFSILSLQTVNKNKLAEGREGYFVDHNSVLFKFGKAAFVQHRELKDLTGRVKELKKEQSNLESTVGDFSKKRGDFEEQRSELLQERRKKEMTLVQENFALQRALADLEKLQKALNQEVLESQTIDLLSKEYEKTCAAISHIEETLEERERELEEWAKKQQEVDEKCEHLQQQFQKALSEWQRMRHELEYFESKEEESRQTQKKLIRERTELSEQIQSTLKWISQRELEAKKQEKELEVLKTSSKRIEEKLAFAREEYERLDSQLIEHRETLEQLEKRVHTLEVEKAQELSVRTHLEEELVGRLGMSLEETERAQVKVENLPEAEEEIRRLRRLVENTGAVNMTAIEEYEHQKERFSHVDQQLADLEEAKGDLEKIISKLDSESRKIFKKTFEEIRTNFHKNFKILFNGGEADLRFTETVDVLEAGIEIVAKPPGKQMRSISLLSGGEKCLTALALLFSIFEVRPAPFCILDEVDAPLDDTNIDRFTNVLKQFTPTTQFIIVTHNKKTMSIADLLVGVSMEEKGVSKLLSLSFEEKQSEAMA